MSSQQAATSKPTKTGKKKYTKEKSTRKATRERSKKATVMSRWVITFDPSKKIIKQTVTDDQGDKWSLHIQNINDAPEDDQTSYSSFSESDESDNVPQDIKD